MGETEASLEGQVEVVGETQTEASFEGQETAGETRRAGGCGRDGGKFGRPGGCGRDS